jgi:hypothetical protein
METITEISVDGDGTLNFFIARLKESGVVYKEKNVLRAGPDMSYKMFEREYLDADFKIFLTGEGRLKIDRKEKTMTIYSSPGSIHKITYSLLKQNYPDYKSIQWRDG